MAELISGNPDESNIGIRLVRSLADEMTYQNLLGLNVLTIGVREQNLMKGEQA